MTTDSTDFEFHFPGLQYCGPGTDLNKRLEADGKTPKAKYKPRDRVDEISLRHDLFYTQHRSARKRLEGDDIMLRELKEITDPTCRERFERAIITPLLGFKRLIVGLWFSMVDRL